MKIRNQMVETDEVGGGVGEVIFLAHLLWYAFKIKLQVNSHMMLETFGLRFWQVLKIC